MIIGSYYKVTPEEQRRIQERLVEQGGTLLANGSVHPPADAEHDYWRVKDWAWNGSVQIVGGRKAGYRVLTTGVWIPEDHGVGVASGTVATLVDALTGGATPD